jgi:Ca2+-binding EF-hand superfamily protein
MINKLSIGNMNSIAFHLEKGMDNGNLTREALGNYLRYYANQSILANKEIEDLHRVLDDAEEFLEGISIGALSYLEKRRHTILERIAKLKE